MRINEESTWKLKVDGRNYINELNNIEKSIVELKEKQSQFQRGTKEYAEATKELKAMEAEYKKLRDSMDIAGMSVKQLKQYKNDLVKEINGLVPGTEKYLEKTKQLSEVNTRLKHVQDDIRAVHDEAKPDRWTRFKELLTAAFTITGILELVSTLRQFGSEAINMAVKLTDTYADMQKATGMSAKEVENLDNNLKNIDTRTSQDGLRQMTVVAGQLGIAAEEVEGFVVGVDKANVALGDEFQGGIEEISKSLGGLKRIFSDTKELKYDEALTRIGSSLNTLGATGSAKAPDIANFASRVAQLGDLAPKTAGEILGLGSGFLELNVSAEIASSGLKNVLTTGAADIKGFSKQLGISTAEMERLINTNPNEFLFKLAESFKGATPTQMVAQLEELGIKSQEGQGAVMLLAKNTEFFRDRQTTANQAFKEGTSIQEEFNIKNNNAAAILDKQTKAIDLQKEALGKQLLPLKIKFFEVVGAGIPIISGLITVVGFLTSALIALPKFIWDNKSAFGFLTLAIVTLNGEMLVATATQLGKTAVDKGAVLWTNAQTAAQTALNLVMRANPIGLLITAVSALIGAFILAYNNSVTVRAGVQGLWAGIKQLGTEIWNFYNALFTLDFDKLKDVLVNAAKRIMSASNTAYNEELKKGKAEEKKIRDAGHDDDKNGHAAKENAKTKKEQEEIEKRNKENAEALSKLQEELSKGTASHAKHEESKTKKAKQEGIQRKKDVEAIEKEIADFRKSQMEWEEREHVTLENKKLQAIAKTQEVQVLTTNLTMLRENNLTNDRMKNLNLLHNLEMKQIRDSKLSQEDKTRKLLELDARHLTTQKDLRNLNHQAFLAVMDAELLRVGNNSVMELDIRKRILDEQQAYKVAMLEIEAQLERNRIEQSVANDQEKAARIKAIEDNRAAETVLITTQTEAEKRRIEQESFQERFRKSSEFYDALGAAMNGDFLAFTEYLQKKAMEDGKSINLRYLGFTKHVAEIGTILNGLLGSWIEHNKNVTASKLTALEKEKDAQFKTLEEQFEKGIITEEQLKNEKLRITGEYDEEVKKLKKAEFEKNKRLSIAMALIQGSMAVLSALATPPFPVGLGLAIVAGVKTAIDIKKIKNQKFEYARGGYVRNAGVPVGPRHGQKYGEGGIALLDRKTGEEVGEMEGGEPILILSRNTYKNNRPVIDKLINSSLYKNGQPIFENGGLLEPLRYGQKYEFGTRTRRSTQFSPDSSIEKARGFSDEEVSQEQVADFSSMSIDAQTTSAENTGLTVEVLNEISAGLGRYLPEFEAIMRQQISQAEMLRQLIDLQTGILNRISDNTGRTADAAAQSKRNDL